MRLRKVIFSSSKDLNFRRTIFITFFFIRLFNIHFSRLFGQGQAFINSFQENKIELPDIFLISNG